MKRKLSWFWIYLSGVDAESETKNNLAIYISKERNMVLVASYRHSAEYRGHSTAYLINIFQVLIVVKYH